MRNVRVLLGCYQCDDRAGAEARGGVEWIRGLAVAGVDLTVLTRTPVERVDRRIADLAGVEVVSLPGSGPPSLTDEASLRRDYLRWNRAVQRWLAGRRLTRFDLAHHLSWGSVTAPTALSAVRLPFVWGPVGGGQICPARLVRLMPPAAACRELGRDLRLLAARWLPWVRRAAASAAVVLATNTETARLLGRIGASRVWSMPDCAVPALPEASAAAGCGAVVPGSRLIWVGRLEPHKAPVVAVRALRMLPERVSMDVVGSGTQDGRLRAEIAAGRLAGRVRMHGQLSHADTMRLMAGASATLFTSLRDSYGPVILESLAHGVPVVALRHQGAVSHPGDLVRTVPVGPAGGLPAALAREVDGLLGTDAATRDTLSRRSRGYVGSEHLWHARIDRMRAAYHAVLR